MISRHRSGNGSRKAVDRVDQAVASEGGQHLAGDEVAGKRALRADPPDASTPERKGSVLDEAVGDRTGREGRETRVGEHPPADVVQESSPRARMTRGDLGVYYVYTYYVISRFYRQTLSRGSPAVRPFSLHAPLALVGNDWRRDVVSAVAEDGRIHGVRCGVEPTPGERCLAWIFSTGASVVGGVWSAGRQTVEQGRHVARDAVAARYRAAMDAPVGAI